MRRFQTCVFLLLLPALAVAQGQNPSFTRTEQRAPCANHQPLRQPFFGELHLHTQYSLDAASLDTRNTPRDAYRFARGEKVGLPPFVDTRTEDETNPGTNVTHGVSLHPYCLPPERCQFTATRTIQLPEGRAIDFAAITDHAEWLGETNICYWEGTVPCTENNDCNAGQVCFGANVSPSGKGTCVPRGYTSESCTIARVGSAKLEQGLGATLFATYVTAENPQRLPFCAQPGAGGQHTCALQAKNVWEQIQRDAEEAYDRTAQCAFTSFIAYEYTGMPTLGQCSNTQAPCFANEDCTGGATCTADSGGANNLHRNIIFRNDDVVTVPLSYVEAPTGCGKGADCQHGGALASPQAMLETLQAQCQDRSGRCEFLSIPHNSNISGGAMFLLPESLKEAKVRARLEPLVELFQIKGSSECRFSASHPGAWNTADELCDFENMSFSKLGGPFLTDPDATTVLPNSYVRNVLKEGMRYQQARGVNPFKLGFVGALDNHNGTPSATDEVQYAKTGAHGDQSFSVSGQILNETNFLGLETNGGGLTVVWAEENSRDALFAAMKRRETYATSGTRPIVRFFGGFSLPKLMCTQGHFAQQGYAGGVPMGSTLTGPSSKAPRFAVSATMDPGWPGHQGTPLQSIQIIKGWVDQDGKTHEAVHDVASQPIDDASVDLRTCRQTSTTPADLCGVWIDPDFDAEQHAFYYARVLEQPSCRWNQYYCNARGVNCSKPPNTTSDTARYTEFEYQQCCSNAVPKTVQQRAWTSPIWYNPAQQ